MHPRFSPETANLQSLAEAEYTAAVRYLRLRIAVGDLNTIAGIIAAAPFADELADATAEWKAAEAALADHFRRAES